eukprot:TRINITY_DN5693_c0_g1_i1.p1 TRINITY_DN5693_c0_g1~~TRINITY_DN5693_c0_g1_i1.p1  ORF type:complete len:373 (+),score=83.48 TRINITY_DN5693_c0_g1_i1:46-1164(+)
MLQSLKTISSLLKTHTRIAVKTRVVGFLRYASISISSNDFAYDEAEVHALKRYMNTEDMNEKQRIEAIDDLRSGMLFAHKTGFFSPYLSDPEFLVSKIDTKSLESKAARIRESQIPLTDSRVHRVTSLLCDTLLHLCSPKIETDTSNSQIASSSPSSSPFIDMTKLKADTLAGIRQIHSWSRIQPFHPSDVHLTRLHMLCARQTATQLPTGKYRSHNEQSSQQIRTQADDSLFKNPPLFTASTTEIPALMEIYWMWLTEHLELRKDCPAYTISLATQSLARLSLIAPFPQHNTLVAWLFTNLILQHRQLPPAVFDASFTTSPSFSRQSGEWTHSFATFATLGKDTQICKYIATGIETSCDVLLSNNQQNTHS